MAAVPQRVFLSYLFALIAGSCIHATAAWRRGRATWYDDAAWMSVHSGSCMYGYLGSRFGGQNNWHVAAISEGADDFSQSCGRCYEVKCVPGKFSDGMGHSIDRTHDCKSQEVVTVAITDKCPCTKPENAYSNKRWCCNDMPHLDLGVWAFRRMADPGKGVIMIDYRPVPCPSHFNNGINTGVQKPSSLGDQYPWHLDPNGGSKSKEEQPRVKAYEGAPDNSPAPSSGKPTPPPSPKPSPTTAPKSSPTPSPSKG